MGYAISVCVWAPDKETAMKCLPPTLDVNGYVVNSIEQVEGEWYININRYGKYVVVFHEKAENIILARLDWVT